MTLIKKHFLKETILLTKITAAQNDVALCYRRVRGLYFVAVVFAATIIRLLNLSENNRTFPKVGPHYKEKACKLLVRSDNSLRPNSYVLFEIFVARRKKYRAVILICKLCAQFSQNRILVIIKHLAFYKIGDSFTFANFSTAYTLTGALYGRDAKT